MAVDLTNVEFSPEEADQIYQELVGLGVSLDTDPLAHGPKRLNAKTAEVRKMLGRCERIYLDLARRQHFAKRELRVASLDLDLAKRNLLATDPETRAGRSVSDREATAFGKLKAEVAKVNHLDVIAQDLEAVLAVVKARRTDLKDTEGRLRDQIRLCAEEIGLGSRWGSKVPGGGSDLTQGIGVVADDSDQVLGQLTGELHLPPRAVAVPAPPESEEDLEEEDEEELPLPLPIVPPAPVLVVKPVAPLTATATSADVDAFLDSVPGGTPQGLPLERAASRATLDESVIDDLLAEFEAID